MLFRSDRKSTRLNSSHLVISYAVFCLKKKKKKSLTAVAVESLSPAAGRHSSTGFVMYIESHPTLGSMRCLLATVVFAFFFFFNDTATTEIYTLSLHDALPISVVRFHVPVPSGHRPMDRAR